MHTDMGSLFLKICFRMFVYKVSIGLPYLISYIEFWLFLSQYKLDYWKADIIYTLWVTSLYQMRTCMITLVFYSMCRLYSNRWSWHMRFGPQKLTTTSDNCSSRNGLPAFFMTFVALPTNLSSWDGNWSDWYLVVVVVDIVHWNGGREYCLWGLERCTWLEENRTSCTPC